MTELSLENFILIETPLMGGIMAAIGALWRVTGTLCERMAKEETKSEIYHPDSKSS